MLLNSLNNVLFSLFTYFLIHLFFLIHFYMNWPPDTRVLAYGILDIFFSDLGIHWFQTYFFLAKTQNLPVTEDFSKSLTSKSLFLCSDSWSLLFNSSMLEDSDLFGVVIKTEPLL